MLDEVGPEPAFVNPVLNSLSAAVLLATGGTSCPVRAGAPVIGSVAIATGIALAALLTASGIIAGEAVPTSVVALLLLVAGLAVAALSRTQQPH